MSEKLLEEIKKVFVYDPNTGDLFREFRLRRKRVGTISTDKHYQVKYKNIMYQKTQIIWVIMVGRFPYGLVDHIDRDGLNDKWDNLREATFSQNRINSNIWKNNTSGMKGVSYHKVTGKWQAKITKDYKQIHLGLFKTPEEAQNARNVKASELFGAFAQSSE